MIALILDILLGSRCQTHGARACYTCRPAPGCDCPETRAS